MNLHHPAFQLRCTLKDAAKSANHLFSRALTNYSQEDDNDSVLPLRLLDQLQQNERSSATPLIFSRLISLCAKSSSFRTGIQLHSAVIKMGFQSNLYIRSAIVDMYSKCGYVESAHNVFDEMPERNVVLWNSLISGFMHAEFPEYSVELFVEMLRTGIAPTSCTISAVFVSCAQLECGVLGSQVHSLSLKSGFCFNAVVGTSLIDMYSKCSNVTNARKVFDHLANKHGHTWTSMATGYAQNGQPDMAMILVREMLRLGFRGSYVTYNTLLSYCCSNDFDYCKHIHCRIVKQGLELNSYLAVALVTRYSRCGATLKDFYAICDNIKLCDQISFNAVVAGFANLGHGKEAFSCFYKMRKSRIDADLFTFGSILKGTGISSALEEGKQTHGLLLKTGYISHVCLQNGLVSMYARCGEFNKAKRVFSSIKVHNIISWNSLISGCANHGQGKEAIEIFEEMRLTTVKPNLTTFLVVLSACSNVGLLDKGLKYFEMLKNYASPRVEHYACIVDLYSRAGYLNEAEAFIQKMPIEPGPSVYKALLSACQVHVNQEIAIRCARKLAQIRPNDPAIYVMLSNVLAVGGYWGDAAKVRGSMHDKGVTKKPGVSWL